MAETLAAILLTLGVFAGAMTAAVATKMNTAQPANPPGLKPLPALDKIFVGPKVSDDEEERRCQIKLGGEHGLTYGDYGWRTTRVPEPVFGPNYYENRDKLIAWAKNMREYIKTQAEADWLQCRTAKKAEEVKPRPKPGVTGSFNIEFHDTGGCGGWRTTQMGFTENVNKGRANVEPLFQVSFATDDGPQASLDGQYHESDFSFSASLTYDNSSGASTKLFGGIDTSARWRLTMRGQFDVDDANRTVIRGSGSLERLAAGTSCDFSYTGKAIG